MNYHGVGPSPLPPPFWQYVNNRYENSPPPPGLIRIFKILEKSIFLFLFFFRLSRISQKRCYVPEYFKKLIEREITYIYM